MGKRKRKTDNETVASANTNNKRVTSNFKSYTGEILPGGPFSLPVNVTVDKLQEVCDALLQHKQPWPMAFYVNNMEVTNALEKYIDKDFNFNEHVLEIVYQPQAVFKVRTVTRCTASIEGHTGSILCLAFSPDGKYLASGSGDSTVRFWDIYTQTPQYTCKGHKNMVMCISWSPCGTKLASGCINGLIYLWDPNTGKQIGKPITGHKKWVMCLAWEPYHKNPECRYLASSSQDCTVRINDTKTSQLHISLGSHTDSVFRIKWGGNGLIYSASNDRTIKVWRAEDGALCRTLKGHGNIVATLSLNVDYVLSTGPFQFGPTGLKLADNPLEYAKKLYDSVGEEKLVSGSDDCTLFLWKPEKETKPIVRMTGHQGAINDVKFSPDGRLIASASFDNSIKLWDSTGTYIAALRGHVQDVHLIRWSPDSRLLLSCSKDSTLKVWSMKTKRLFQDLPGHADQVNVIDWSLDGLRVASGGKDKVLRLWQN